MRTLLSVIIPCYNHGAYLHGCVDSILSQCSTDVEIIIIDDGSTDNSVQVARSLPPPVRLLTQPNAGPAAARNRGLSEAHGKYVAFLDADDIWLPGFAATMIPALESSMQDTAAVVCGWQLITPDGAPIGIPRYVNAAKLQWPQLVLANPITMNAALCRTQVIRQIRGFDTSIIGTEDWDLWLRIVGAGYRLLPVPAILVGYRVLPKSVSRNPILMFENSLKVLDKAFTNPSLPSSALSQRNKAYAWQYLNVCASLYENNRDSDAEQYYREGVNLWPDLLCMPHTMYTLACSRQPFAYKMSGLYLDLGEAEARSRNLLLSFRNAYAHQVQRGLGELYRALAQLARIQHNWARARQFALKAFSHCPTQHGVSSLLIWMKTWADPWRTRWRSKRRSRNGESLS